MYLVESHLYSIYTWRNLPSTQQTFGHNYARDRQCLDKPCI